MQQEEFKDVKCNFNLYRAFYAVAITGSFSEAAKLLNVSQPALSYSIKQLEEQLFVTLFYRKSKKLTLTEDGKKILKHVKSAFDSFFQIEKELNNSNRLKNNIIVIGCPTYLIDFILIDKIKKILENKKMNIKIVEKGTKELKQMLTDNQIDIMIDINLQKDSNFTFGKIMDLNCCFACSSEYYKNSNIQFSNVNEKQFVLPATGGYLRNICDKALNDKNIFIKPLIEVYTTETLKNFTLKNFGIGFFIEKSIERELNDEKLVKINFLDCEENIEVNYLSNFEKSDVLILN